MSVTIGSLFSGIGGLELGLEQAGLGPVLWQVEKDPFCQQVLAKHWPDAERYEDVRSIRASGLLPVDIICGGFPCQDVSSAGKRKGLRGDRSGLWWEFARIVDAARPRFVVVENVASGASRWLCPVRTHLHQLGYRTRALGVAASDIGAPHRRARIFIVAYAEREQLRQQPRRGRGASGQGALELGVDGASRFVADAAGSRLNDAEDSRASRGYAGQSEEAEERRTARNSKPERSTSRIAAADSYRDGQPPFTFNAEMAGTPTPPGSLLARRERSGPGAHEGWPGPSEEPWRAPVGGLVPVVHGLSGGMVGRGRRARIRALGNAVVPAQAKVVGYVVRQLAGLGQP